MKCMLSDLMSLEETTTKSSYTGGIKGNEETDRLAKMGHLYPCLDLNQFVELEQNSFKNNVKIRNREKIGDSMEKPRWFKTRRKNFLVNITRKETK